jgi:pimeloyl-ACP methyl ester carboxylesterase
MTEPMPTFLDVTDAVGTRRIAVIESGSGLEGDASIVWLGGYRSDMTGTKAVALEAHAATLGQHVIRFDYSGHGQSSGHYTDGTISTWLADARAVIDACGRRNLVLVGSSMGGWIALRLIADLRARGEGDRIRGLILIAPAPDFTHDLIEPTLSDADRKALAEQGYIEEKSDYSDEPNRFTRALIEDGRNNLVLTGLIETGCPVHILQGMRDVDVPYGHALRIMEKIVGDDAVLTLVRDGDHRLSRPEDIERMLAAVTAMTAPA